MAPLLEYRQFSTTDEHGRDVCYDHRELVCDVCLFDSTQHIVEEEFDEEDDLSETAIDYFADPDEIRDILLEEDVNPDQVNVLWGEIARYHPDEDTQIQSEISETDRRSTSPPSPLSSYALRSCDECQLRWMVGKDGTEAASTHPSHHTVWHQFSGTQRSLLVQVSAACSGAETEEARAAVGIYFDDNSEFNTSQPLLATEEQSQRRADIESACSTLILIQRRVLARRRAHILEHGRSNTEKARRNALHMRVVLATSSRFLVEGICHHRASWRWDSWHCGFSAPRGETIEYSMAWKQLEDMIRLLAKEGVQVAFWYVLEGEVWKASQLAWSCWDKDSPR